jgi:hypothetical protein
LIYGHTTNIAANGIFKIYGVTTNTFKLQDEFTGKDVAGSGAGAGSSGIVVAAPPVLLVSDMKNVILQVGTTGTATMTLKVAGSLGLSPKNSSSPRYDYPNMGATVVSGTDPYTFIQVINLDTGAAINGATGLVAGGADINYTYEVNINAMKYLTVFPISWSAGVLTVKALLNTAI